jgi:hypothetical protein
MRRGLGRCRRRRGPGGGGGGSPSPLSKSWVYPAARRHDNLPSTMCVHSSLALFQQQSIPKNQRNKTHYQTDLIWHCASIRGTTDCIVPRWNFRAAYAIHLFDFVYSRVGRETTGPLWSKFQCRQLRVVRTHQQNTQWMTLPYKAGSHCATRRLGNTKLAIVIAIRVSAQPCQLELVAEEAQLSSHCVQSGYSDY